MANKKLLLLAFCMLSGASASGLLAQSPPDTNTQQILKTTPDHNPIRHRMPSSEWDSIGFSYANGTACFTMPDYITYIKVCLESESGENFSSYVYASNPIWSVNLPQGEYYIECDADEGSLFEGFVYID